MVEPVRKLKADVSSWWIGHVRVRGLSFSFSLYLYVFAPPLSLSLSLSLTRPYKKEPFGDDGDAEERSTRPNMETNSPAVLAVELIATAACAVVLPLPTSWRLGELGARVPAAGCAAYEACAS
jgi:hypothetical protein